jgi:hypothetical protein
MVIEWVEYNIRIGTATSVADFEFIAYLSLAYRTPYTVSPLTNRLPINLYS